MSRLKTGLKVSAWVAIFIVAVVYLQRYGIAPLQSAVNDMGIWAPLYSESQGSTMWQIIGLFLLRGVSIILPALPSSVYSLLAGSLLGFKAGYLTIILSDLVFCSAAFFIARRWGRGPVSRLVGASAMKRIDGFSKNQLEGNFFLMTGLLMTGLFDFLSYAIGISRTHWRLFAPALLISVLISDSISVIACWRRSIRSSWLSEQAPLRAPASPWAWLYWPCLLWPPSPVC